MNETLERRASVNVRLSSLNNKWRVLIVIQTVPAACSRMFGRTKLACFNNLKINPVVIEFRDDGLVCEIMFTSVPAGVDPSLQARPGLFLNLVTAAGGSYFPSTQPIGSVVSLQIHPTLPLLISRISLKAWTHLSCSTQTRSSSFGEYKVFTVNVQTDIYLIAGQALKFYCFCAVEARGSSSWPNP